MVRCRISSTTYPVACDDPGFSVSKFRGEFILSETIAGTQLSITFLQLQQSVGGGVDAKGRVRKKPRIFPSALAAACCAHGSRMPGDLTQVHAVPIVVFGAGPFIFNRCIFFFHSFRAG